MKQRGGEEPYRPVAESDPSRIDRRTFLAGVVATALAAAACTGDDGDAAGGTKDPAPSGSLPALPPDLPAELFALGVASGDPLHDSVILWTRVVADPRSDGGGVGGKPIPVGWEVATDDAFDDVVASGKTVADPALAHSVHVDANPLDPDRWYRYRFTVGDRTSPVGRTRTAPRPGDEPDRLRFAFASCQNRQAGHWNAHRHLAEEDLDLVVFLGDYIYDDAPNPNAVRPYQSADPSDLATYRNRWAEYKADPVLQAAHARCPWVCTWDDHEVSGNYAADVSGSDSPGDEGLSAAEFLDRRAAAYQAYYEHLPLRLDAPRGPAFPIHRDLAWGTLARFYVLDTRQYRSDQAEGDPNLPAGSGPISAAARDESRTMLGPEQEAWLGDALADGEATWNVLAQSVVMSTLPFAGEIFNLDQWDGYPAARRRLLQQVREVRNPVVIAGDFHISALSVITLDPEDPATEPVATEVVGTSISSNFPASFAGVVEATAAALPHIRHVNVRQRGYVVCEATAQQLQVEYRVVSTTAIPEADVATDATWIIDDGNPEPRRA